MDFRVITETSIVIRILAATIVCGLIGVEWRAKNRPAECKVTLFDEKMHRAGQSVAPASLPEVTK